MDRDTYASREDKATSRSGHPRRGEATPNGARRGTARPSRDRSIGRPACATERTFTFVGGLFGAMEEDVHEYDGEDVDVTYDVRRCIHVRECVRGLPEVFDPDRRPWVDPDGAPPDELAEVIERCPTGALHYRRADGREEVVPGTNTVTVAADGPHYVRGDVEIASPDGDVLLSDTRVALCRCGASANKPLCDGSHRDVEFEASGTVADNSGAPNAPETGGTLSVVPAPNGPLQLYGGFEIRGADDDSHVSASDVWLCRCGASGNKPFCDGTHARIGFSTEGEG